MPKILDVLLILLLILLVAFLGYKIYELTPQEKQDLKIFISQSQLPETNASSELVMFLPNMRFNTNRLSYYFSDCEQEKQERVLDAFSIISLETKNIFFFEINSEEEAKIKVYCSEIKKPTRNNTFVAGEGGPDSLLNLSLYPLINSGQVYLYKTQKDSQCEYPVVEIHELMHVFGFDHIDDKSTILYPYISCDQRINQEIIFELKKLYSIPPMSDLWIKRANASKGGIYLNFEISIENRGLIKAEMVELEIYDNSNNKKIGNFTMQNLEPGTTNTITLQNFKLPSRSTNNLKFKIKTTTLEYFYDNNEFLAKLTN